MSENPLTRIFASKSLVRLLTAFLAEPDRAFYQQELVAVTGGSLRPVQLALDRLTGAGLVTKRRQGKQVYYRADTSNPAFGDLRSLFFKTFALADVLRDRLAPLAAQIDAAFVFGSVAAGEQGPQSDVDLAVVGTAGRKELSAALGGAELQLGREINLVIYGADRLRRLVRDGDGFVLDVVAKPKIWVIGDQSDLDRLAR
jgi:predicted nucleotidyltransferase